ncbi:MAG: hypothetical protein LQ350_004401 [Teloschistes chrysophthalmus]|nr:MAG: hypothetical protein LQ350_004401 [Niorma chrysophthalma]
MSDDTLPFLTASRKTKAGALQPYNGSPVNISSDRYHYSPLGERQIRLLRLSLGPKPGYLIGKFEVKDLASVRGAYKAISYCWGNPTKTHRVLFSNGQSLHVTGSAADILTNVFPRYPDDAFWIDQLCINQDDNKERSSQVLLMGEIYSSTKQVIAWLGLGDAKSDKAVDFVEMLFKEIQDMKRQGKQSTLAPLMASAPRLRTFLPEMQRERKWDALSLLLRNTWFERVWVMQEVIMACSQMAEDVRPEDHTLLSFEKRTISFDKLAEVLAILERDHLVLNLIYDRENSDGTKDQGTDPPGVNALRLFSSFRELRDQAVPVRLSTALDRSWRFKATNPRDKLYAVMGFCDDCADPRLSPNYDADVEYIYQVWTEVLLERPHEHALPLPMAGVGLRRLEPTLPSWVPDYSSGSYEVQAIPTSARGGQGEKYRASGTEEKFKVSVDHSSASITLKVIPIDKIEVLFPQPLTTEEQGARWYSAFKSLSLTPEKAKYIALVEWLGTIENFLETSSPEVTRDRSQLIEVLAQTLSGSYPTEGAAPDTYLSEVFSCWYQAHRELSGKEKSRVSTSMSRTEDFYDNIQVFENLKAIALQDRPVFDTEQRRLFGHGPKGLMVGDTVCIVKGAVTPFLFRQIQGGRGTDSDEEEKWNLVGPCFVHGLMYGEGLNMGNWQEIVVV